MVREYVRYSRELADRICAMLSEGQPLKRICRGEDMPSPSAVRGWALDDVDGFFDRYERARKLGADALADDLLTITDNRKSEDAPLLGIASRNLSWLLSKWYPARYGERLPPPMPALPPVVVYSVSATRQQQLPAPVEGEFTEVRDEEG